MSTRSSKTVSDPGIPSLSMMLNLFTTYGNFDLLEILSSKINKRTGLSLYEIIGRSKMSRTKCLKRLTELQEIGLVFKMENQYYASNLGGQIFDQLVALRDTVDVHSKLKAVDVMQSNDTLIKEEVSKLVQSLIASNDIKYKVMNILQIPVLSQVRKVDLAIRN
jgi:hypothetical protein